MDFITPPRAELAIDKSLIPFYEKKGWVCQVKKNGTCSVIHIDKNGEITAKTRHGEYHKAWSFSEDTKNAFKRLIPFAPIVVVAELLHNKVPGIRNINYIHDILMFRGNLLLKNYAFRLSLLQKIFEGGIECESHYEIDSNTWLVKNIREDFLTFSQNLSKPEDEGIVLKNPNSVWNVKKDFWSVKWRRRTKNYSK